MVTVAMMAIVGDDHVTQLSSGQHWQQLVTGLPGLTPTENFLQNNLKPL